MQRITSPDSKGQRPDAGRLQRWVPGIKLLRQYPGSSARPDLVAGVVLAAILVPQGMAYAELAGLPAVTGLYTTVACLVGYALFGPSRVLVLGPDSSISPLILASITPLLVTGDPGSAIVLAGMLAIFVGLIEIGLGLGKLGFVADLLSKEVQVGYMNGLGITIIVGQLPKLFGFSTDADSFLGELKAFVEGVGQTHTATLVLGLAVLGNPARSPAHHQTPSGDPGRGGGRDRGFRRLRPCRPRGRDRRIPSSGGAHPRTFPGRAPATSRRCCWRRSASPWSR